MKEKYTEADFLAHMHIPTLIDDKHAIALNKIFSLAVFNRWDKSKHHAT
jgi:hypothetical protein